MPGKQQNFSIKDLPCSKVIVYKDRAEVQREIRTNLKRGETQIEIDSLSPCMDIESVRVEVSCGNGILIDVIVNDKIIIDEKIEDTHSGKEDEGIFSAKNSDTGHFEIDNEKNDNKKDELIKDDDNKPGEDNKKITNTQKTIKNYDFKDDLKKCLEMNQKLRNLNKFKTFSKNLNKSIHARNNLQLKEINEHIRQSEKNLLDPEADTNKLINSEIKILVGSNEDAQVTLLLSYFVFNVTWEACYDFRTFTSEDEKSTVIYYYGLVNNTSGEDWKNTRLWLTTGEPPMCGSMVAKLALQTNILHAKQNKTPKLTNITSGLNNHLNELERMGSERQVKPLSSATDTNLTFEIPRTSTVLSDMNKEDHKNRYTIRIIDLNTDFSYETMPKKIPFAFLKATCKNKFNIPMLPGLATIFLNNNFVCRSKIPFVNERDDFYFDLGVDHQIKVNYKVKQEVKSEYGFFKKRSIINFYQIIEIENKTSSNIKLAILGNFPKSNKKEDVKVKLINPKIKKLSESITVDKELNIITFRVRIPPKGKQEEVIKYAVDYPSKTELNII